MVLSRTRSRKFLYFATVTTVFFVILFHSGSDLKSKIFVQIQPEDKSSESNEVVAEKSNPDSKIFDTLSVSTKLVDLKLPDEVLLFPDTCDKKGIQAILIEPCLLAQTLEPKEKELLKNVS